MNMTTYPQNHYNHGHRWLDVQAFTWDGRAGCTEISDLGPSFRPHQIWNDSCDVGFTVINNATRQLHTFVETARIREDGAVVEWIYTSINPSTGRIDKFKDAFTITIFND